MKTQSIEWARIELNGRRASRPVIAWRAADVLRTAGKAGMALLPALAIVIAAAWFTSNPQVTVYLQVTLWTSGFVFLGLVLDANPRTAALLAATGIALPVLALLSSYYTVEIAIVGATLIALWVSVAVWQSSGRR